MAENGEKEEIDGELSGVKKQGGQGQRAISTALDTRWVASVSIKAHSVQAFVLVHIQRQTDQHLNTQ